MNNSHEQMITRQNAYSFLASLFLLEPKQENIVEVQEELNQFLSEQDQIEVFVTQPEEVDNLTQEFYDLFFVPSSGAYVPPFESTLKNYRSKEKKPYGRLFSKDAVHVQSCYETVGFIPWKMKIFEPLRNVKFPDHIGYELAFMAVLCANEWASREDEEKALQWKNLQHQFLSEHLSKWIDNFAQAMENNAQGFYQKAGMAARNLVLEDLEILTETVFQAKGVLQ